MVLITALLINTAIVFAWGADETTDTQTDRTLDTDSMAVLSLAETASVANTASGPAGIEDGAVYALQNVGSELWASTSLNTATYFYIWDMFQNSIWNNSAQTFKFVKTGSDDNTYLIYPFEYNNYNANMTRALYCNYNLISSQQPAQVNVTYANYVASKASCYEWIVEQEDGYIHTIRLKADPRYILCGLGDTAGHEGADDAGNIVVSKQSSATATPTNYQKWNIEYVVDDMSCYIRNRENNRYLYTSNVSGSNVCVLNYAQLMERNWQINHIQNGIYFIQSVGGLNMCVNEISLMEGGDVYVDSNTAQSEFMWRIDRLQGGYYRLYNYYSDLTSSDYSLKVTDSTLTPNKVIYGSYSANENYHDEWYFTDNYDVAFYGIPSNQGGVHNHSSYLLDIEDLLTERDSTFFDITSQYSETFPALFISSLSASELFVIRTHGGRIGEIIQPEFDIVNNPPYYEQYATFIVADEDEGLYLFSHTPPNLSQYNEDCAVLYSDHDYSNAELVILAGCYTGSEDTNLVSKIQLCGARTVIGFKDEIVCDVANVWIEKLFEELNNESRIIDAVESACIAAGYPIENVNFRGDGNYYLP